MNKKGFTMVELLAVIVVLGIVASIAIVSMSGIRNQVDIRIVQGNLDAAIEAARMQGEKDLVKLESNPILIKVKKLKTITDLDIDKSYNNIQIKVFLAKNRAYACINNEDALVSIVGEDNRDKFTSYYCSSYES